MAARDRALFASDPGRDLFTTAVADAHERQEQIKYIALSNSAPANSTSALCGSYVGTVRRRTPSRLLGGRVLNRTPLVSRGRRRLRRAALLFVLIHFRLLLFAIAALLTLCHDDLLPILVSKMRIRRFS